MLQSEHLLQMRRTLRSDRRVLAIAGDREQGVASLSCGADTVIDWQATPVTIDAAVKAALAGAIAVTTRAKTDKSLDCWSTLSARERDVLRRLLEARSNVEIAELLHISPETVKTHVSSLIAKSGSRNRVELGLRAERDGLGL